MLSSFNELSELQQMETIAEKEKQLQDENLLRNDEITKQKLIIQNVMTQNRSLQFKVEAGERNDIADRENDYINEIALLQLQAANAQKDAEEKSQQL